MTSSPLNLPYSGIPSFMRSPIVTDLASIEADYAILGVPTDDGGPWKPGTRFGPRGIREQSMRFAAPGSPQAPGGYFDVESGKRYLEPETRGQRIVDCGDVDITYTNRERTFENITDAVRGILKAGAMPVVLGGDHGITYPVVRAFDEPLTMVQFDAHMDYGRPTEHVTLSNGMPMRLSAQLPIVQKLVQVGIRGLRTRQSDVEDSTADGNVVIPMKTYRDVGIDAILDAIPPGSRTYITVDIDALDLPLIPGCASAELGGFGYEELRDAVFAVIRHANVVGFDLVEINPMLDVASGATSFIGAQLVTEMIGRIAEQSRAG